MIFQIGQDYPVYGRFFKIIKINKITFLSIYLFLTKHIFLPISYPLFFSYTIEVFIPSKANYVVCPIRTLLLYFISCFFPLEN